MIESGRNRTILAIDPGTRWMGVAVVEGRHLVDQGVETLSASQFPATRLSEVRTVMRSLIRRYQPGLVAVEGAFFAEDHNTALLNLIVEEIRVVARLHGIEVRSFSPSAIRKRLCGNGRATKGDVAHAVAAEFPELRRYLGARTARQRRYYGNMFDAVAVGLAASEPPPEPAARAS